MACRVLACFLHFLVEKEQGRFEQENKEKEESGRVGGLGYNVQKEQEGGLATCRSRSNGPTRVLLP